MKINIVEMLEREGPLPLQGSLNHIENAHSPLTSNTLLSCLKCKKTRLWCHTKRAQYHLFLNRSNGASKNPSFRTDFINVHMILVKSSPKKSFSQKIILPIENLLVLAKKLFYQLKISLSPKKIGFLSNSFFGVLFTNIICTFLKSV